MYDFDETQLLSLDEMVLAFRSTLSGLSKLSKIDPPTEAEVEVIVVQGFDTIRKAQGGADIEADYSGIDKDNFLDYCLNTPEIMSWIEFFDDLEEYEQDKMDPKPLPIPKETHTTRSDMDASIMDRTLGGFAKYEWEKKGPAKDSNPRQNWENVIPFLAPPRSPDQPRDMPRHNIKLDWAYGYNGHSGKQNLFYSAKGEAIYGAGAIAVVHDILNATQRFFTCHTDVITALKVTHTPEGATLIATGECGIRPAIHVWNCENLKLISTMRGFHRGKIAQLDFSPDQTKLTTLGGDVYNSVAVYEWRTGDRLFSARTTCDPVHDIRYISDDVFASCGKDHIYFWKEMQRGGFKRYRGLFGTATRPETLWTVNKVGTTVVTGSASGFLHVWEGRNLVSSIKGHTGPVYASFVVGREDERGLVTACSGGKIQVWNEKLEVGATFNAAIMGAIEPAVHSICWDLLTSKIIIGFKTCEIFEMDATDGRNLHRAAVCSNNNAPRVAGVSRHPMKPNIFCCVGDDRTVRIYDADLHQLLRMSLLDTMGHCCEFSPDGSLILIGMGSGIVGKEERKEGAYCVLNEEDLTLLHESRDTKHLITDCKYSPEGDMFCLSSADGSLYVYNSKDFAARARCRGHSGKVLHVDFSNDGQYLMSNCSNGELLFWDAEKGELQAPKAMKEVQWETNSCTMSYPTKGMWGPLMDAAYVNNTARSNGRELIVSTDSYGRVRVYNAPVFGEDPNYVELQGHGKNAQRVTFACDDSLLLTTGGSDGTVFQWNVDLPEVQEYEDMKKDDSLEKANAVGKPMVSEMAFEGKTLDRTEKDENVIHDRPLAQCLMEEGEEDVSALLPWQRTIVAPSRVPAEDNSEPPDTLELEFIYGMSTDVSRKCLTYAPDGDVIFFVGSTVVIMNQKRRVQKFYCDHADNITALDCHRASGMVASGDRGELPVIRVWNPSTMETHSVLEGFHRRGIVHVAFSPDGTLLATAGMDNFHTVAVYDWACKTVVSHTRGLQMKSFHLDFAPNGTQIIQCGNEMVRFWDLDGRNVLFQDALFGGRAKMQGFLCAGWIGNSAVVGTSDGTLYRFVGRQLDGMVMAHNGCVNCISSSNEGVVTGGDDGFVKIWTQTLECRIVLELKLIGAFSLNARTISWDTALNRIAIGTMAGEIFEVGAGDGENLHPRALLEAHDGAELCGLSVNPTKDEFATVGEDGFLRVWDIFSHETVNTVPLEMGGRVCAYAPDARTIAIALGSPRVISPRQYDGKWIVLDTNDYQIVHEARDSTKWLTDMKFSPSGETLVMGGYDNKIYVYNVLEGYNLVATITQHAANILNVDVSADNAWIQANCGGQELAFFEADTGIYIPAASRLRDQEWGTNNCSMSWATQGIWPAHKDGTMIEAVDCNLYRGADGTIVAAGDNRGRIGLYRYPCTSAFACKKSYRASASAITRMRFCAGDSLLINLGGFDRAIYQWAHKRDRQKEVAYNVIERRGAIEEEEEDVLKLFGLAGADEALPDMNEVGQLISSRPWVASMIAPSDAKEDNPEVPFWRLEMGHVFGLQASNTRASVRFNAGGDIILPASRYVCVYNKKRNAQIFYEGHETELSNVCVSEDGRLAASVERCNRPRIHVWDAQTTQIICILPLLHRRGVVHMAFSPDNKRLLSVGQDQDHSIALWESVSSNWLDGRLLAVAKGDVNPALFAAFYKKSTDGYVIASGGRFHQKFWYINGRCLNANYPEYDSKQKIGTLLCGTSVGHTFVSGATSGHLYIWQGRKLARMVRAHELGVTCIWACDKGVVTAAKDGLIKLWSPVFEHIRSFMLADADVPPIIGSVRSIDAFMSTDGSAITRVLASTAGGEIYEIAARSGGICLLHESHYTGELWGLCVHPTNPDLFCTVSDDRSIRVWSVSSKRLLRKALLDCTARCVTWSHDGRHILVGLGGSWDGKRGRKDGGFIVLDAVHLKPIFEGRDSRHWLQDCKFSPDGRSFAVGSMDHKIYIYNRETFRLKGTCDRHNSFVKTFDYSEDSVYIQSDSGDYEHLYFEAEDGEYFAAGSQLKNIHFADWTCTYGWPVQGTWPYFDDVEKGLASEPTTVHRSPGPEESLLIAGNSRGAIKLYNFPCLSKDAKCGMHKGHVRDCAKVRFSCDGKHAISIGKYDKCIMIWNIIPDTEMEAEWEKAQRAQLAQK
jgi:WD40 repeat protein